MDVLEKTGGCCNASGNGDCSTCESGCKSGGGCGSGGRCGSEGGSCGGGCATRNTGCSACGCRSDKKLNVYDWLQDIPESHEDTDFIEVQFKNTRKGYYKNSNKIKLEKGDIVAVESNPGHDIGEVTLTGRLVLLQMKKNNVRLDNPDVRRVYRKAKPNDLEKYEEAKAREHSTMLRARKIAENLNLNMKIGDVEYQGDGNKAIFYYIADDRVDFRQLIKVLAENFRVRIEMKQIGARQEAGRIGGIGPCGRELCCSGWMTSFVSVATSAARYQDISLNPQKLAGQCAKLKCCLNYEVDTYVEAQKQLPSREVVLSTKDNDYFHFKTDIHKRMISYSTSRDFAANIITISASRAFEIIALNKRGVRVDSLEGEARKETPVKEFSDVVGQDSLTRFDKNKKNKKRKKGRGDGPESERPDHTSRRDERPRREERQPREDRGNREERNHRENRNNRDERTPREERNNREDRNRRDERSQSAERPPREDRANEERTPREDRNNREGKNRREDRQQRADRPQREERAPNESRQPREERTNGEERTPRENRPPRPERPNRPNSEQKQNNREADLSKTPKEQREKKPQPASQPQDAHQAQPVQPITGMDQSGENKDRRDQKKGPRRHHRPFDKKKGNNDKPTPAPSQE